MIPAAATERAFASPPQPWHMLEPAAALARLRADAARGLDPAEAAARLARDGPNALTERGGRGAWRVLWEQLASAMVALLAAAVAVSALLGDWADAAAIVAILVLNTLLGYVQEHKAEKALAALKRLSEPKAKVRRGGRVLELPSRELVRGDIVLLEAGNRVPADCRVLESAELRVEEAALTGESEPARKGPAALADPELPLGDRRGMAYMGTTAVAGRGLALVVETGMATELGRIAALLGGVMREPTPLQRQLEGLGRVLAGAALGVVGVFFTLGLLRGEPMRLMFMTAVSMAVAAVPEGLPAVVTVALALAAQRMLARRALIRKLPAVETLGSVTVICTDKTGTLTENRMAASVLEADGRRLDLSAAPKTEPDPAFALLLAAGALCGDAVLEPEPDADGRFRAVGDPTEGAWVSAAAALGLAKPDLERVFPRVAEAPFDSGRKRMATVQRLAGEAPALLRAAFPGPASGAVFVKGSAAALLEVSTRVWTAGRAEPLTPESRRLLVEADDRLARRGMRVLGAAFRPLEGTIPEKAEWEQDLIFLGLAGLIDPPRPEAREAVRACRAAGIRPVMITGDHPLTAQSIAEDLGISAGEPVLTGPELARLSGAELEEAVGRTSVFARVAPEHKLRIVTALQTRGQVVAMTGDGVNDAPALQKADIGVAMGVTGTDVAKDASAMVLLDDNFATIVAAVREGRVVYDNIRKFVRYLMTTNSGELWLMLLAPFLGMPLPLLPLQILWINLLTDGLPALALGFEPAESDVMTLPPRRSDARIVDRGLARHVLWVGLLMALLCLGAGWLWWSAGRRSWQTLVLVSVICAQLGHALAIRSERASVFTLGFASNPVLLGSVALTALAQLAIVYAPPLSRFFHTVPLSAAELALCVAVGAAVFGAVEAEKCLLRRGGSDGHP